MSDGGVSGDQGARRQPADPDEGRELDGRGLGDQTDVSCLLQTGEKRK